MKRLIALLLAAVLVLSLAACGGGGDTTSDESGDTTGGESNSMTKEEMLEVAVVADEVEIGNAIYENIVNAKQAYCGKVLEVSSIISAIDEDSISLGQVGSFLTVYLPEEDIANLQLQQSITVVGVTNDDIQTDIQVINGTEFEQQCLVMEQAYLVTDRYEFTGTVKSKNDSYTGAWNVEFPGQSVQKVVYFDDGIDVSQYIGEEITFTAQVIDFKYYNAIIE